MKRIIIQCLVIRLKINHSFTRYIFIVITPNIMPADIFGSVATSVMPSTRTRLENYIIIKSIIYI